MKYPTIRVRGSARERGQQIGSRAHERITRSIGIYRDLFHQLAGMSWQEVVSFAAQYWPVIKAYEPRYLEEVKGIAEGANVSPLDVLAINVRTELRNAIKARAVSQECTAFVALPENTQDKSTILGQNWDWYPGTTDTVIVLEVEQEDRPNYVTIVEAGLLAKTGFNSAGLGLVTNAMVSDQDRGQPYVPYHVILRGILDARSIEDARIAIQRSPLASSANYLFADRSGRALNVETFPGHANLFFSQPNQDGVLAHTNHFTDNSFNHTDVLLWEGSNSIFRLNKIQSLFERADGPFTVDMLQTFLGDHTHHPDSICTHPDTQLEPVLQYASIASIIMDLNLTTLWLADGNPCETPYRELNYRDFLT